jgi:spermidine synthase
VELDPTLPSVMKWFYPDAGRYLRNPLGHVIISDGRNYVRLTNKHYDLITVDAPPPVWSAGAVVLMTHEFYQEARQRLGPGGVLASFLPYGGQSKLLIRTFRASFRYMTVIRGPRPYGMYLLGSQAPMDFTASAITRVFGSRAARADLAGAPDYGPVPVASWPSIIRRHVWMTNGQVNAYAGPGPLLTDDHPLSEYFLIHDLRVRAKDGLSRSAFQLALVVTGLFGLLVIGVVLEALWRRRRPVP